MLHISTLVPQLAVLHLYVHQPVHFDLELVKLTGSVEVLLFGAIAFLELLAELAHLLFSSTGPIHFHLNAVLRRKFISPCVSNGLLVVGFLLGRNQFDSSFLIVKLTLDPVTLLPQALRKPVLSFLHQNSLSVMLLFFESCSLHAHVLLDLFFYCLLP